MREKIIDDVMYEINELLRSKKFIGAKIEYVLINKKDIKDCMGLISDKKQNLYKVDLKNREIRATVNSSYDIDKDIFAHLENEYEIGFMSLEIHSNVWNEIGVKYNDQFEKFEHELGVQEYLKYCKKNNINKKLIDEKVNNNVYDVKDDEMEDGMKYYDETIDYIEIENKQIKIPQEMYQKYKEIQYLSFYIGRNLLGNISNSLNESEEDRRVYNFCKYLAKKFIESNYYEPYVRSNDICLERWIDENETEIYSEYLYYFEFDNSHILETKSIEETEVALIEIKKQNRKEYIIATEYNLNNRKLYWSNAYYYNGDFEKAKEDFEKVKAGGNLADIFELQTSENDKVKEIVENKKEFIEQVIKKQKKPKEKER